MVVYLRLYCRKLQIEDQSLYSARDENCKVSIHLGVLIFHGLGDFRGRYVVQGGLRVRDDGFHVV